MKASLDTSSFISYFDVRKFGFLMRIFNNSALYPLRVIAFLAVFPSYPVFAHHQFLAWNPFPDQLLYTKQFYSANLPITIGWGSIELLNNEFTPGVCPDGVSDSISAIANVYVVPSGSVYRNSSIRISLMGKDVTGAVNTVIQDSGNFFNETIGTTGSVPVGKYAVVYDECQDGFFDDSVDFLFDPAFEVLNQVPPISPDAINNLKAAAKQQADHYAHVAALTGALWYLSNLNDIFGAVTDPADLVIWLTYTFGPMLADHFTADPFEETNKLLLNNINRSLAIYADPPDAAFKRLMSLGARTIVDPQSADPLFLAIANLGTAASTQDALSEALLRSLERYQGADAAGDGDWALIHARLAKQYAGLLATQLPHINDALNQLADALASDSRPLDALAGDVETFRNQVITTGFSTDERQMLANLGLTPVDIDKLQSDLAIRSFAFTKADLLSAITKVQTSNTGYVADLNNLAASMEATIGTLQADALVINRAPQANAGGPYNGIEGNAVTFDGNASTSPSSIIAYEWDLDGDGAFNDATGPVVSFTYTRPFHGLIGLKVTNTDGLADVAYAPVTIENVNSPPQITAFLPTDRSLKLSSGGSQMFEVTANDPNGDAVNITWRVDGVPSGTGPAFTYASSTASGGLHVIHALAADANPLGGEVRQSWVVELPPTPDSANLSLAMKANSDIRVGGDLVYRMAVTNNGPAGASNVTLTDNLPAGVTFKSFTASQGACSLADRLATCALGNLASGASATADITVTPLTTAKLTNTASVTATEFDPNVADNTASLNVEVNFEWARQFGTPGSSLNLPLDSVADATNVYTVGALGPSVTRPQQIFINKFDGNGNELWSREYNGGYGTGVAIYNNSIYMVGYSNLNVGFIRKYDTDGNEIWIREFTGGWAWDVAVDETGVYVIGGGAPLAYFPDMMLRKYDFDGNELWTREYDDVGVGAGMSVALDDNGVYAAIMTGNFFRTVIRKFDKNGSEIWTRQINFDLQCAFTLSHCANIAVDESGVYIAGQKRVVDQITTLDSYLRKYNKDGAELWTWQSNDPRSDVSNGIAATGNFVYLVGAESQDFGGFYQREFANVRKFDINGTELSSYHFESSIADNLTAVTEVSTVSTGCSGDFITGVTDGVFPGVEKTVVARDVFVMKIKSSPTSCVPGAPTINAGNSMISVAEGQTANNSGSFASANLGENISISASAGAISQTGTTAGNWAWSFFATDGSAQNQAVTVTADNGNGGLSTALFELVVHNIAPSVKINGAPASSPAGTPINLTASVMDASPEDTSAGFSYAWNVYRDSTLFTSGNAASFSFTPNLSGNYQVTLQAADKDGGANTDTMTITVEQTNQPPIANAGPDQTVNPSQLVTLDGSGSSDPDNGPEPLSFVWTQTSGPAVTLTGADTSSPQFTPSETGEFGFALVVNDGLAESTSDSVRINVVNRSFTGFFQPVDNQPTVNKVTAGSGVPIKFSLGGDKGLEIFAPGYPKSQPIACSSSSPTDPIEETVTAGSSGLIYNADVDQYDYIWKTTKSWKGTCRRFILKLNDGTEKMADFIFK
jgi:uncharacterized repeat protein (TIGR01451 family)